MRVLAIDPGYDRMGVAIMELKGGKEILLYSTCLQTKNDLPLPERLFLLGKEIEALLKTYKPTILGIETLFFNTNQKTGIGVAQARGMILYLAKKFDCVICEYGPQEIKIAVTGYGKSDKKAVIDMVKRLVLDVPTTALDDEYDAIAVGITCLAHNRTIA
jgi:crossover junction endodeoxyribonuclease RuvC